jgi:hypothetical protein
MTVTIEELRHLIDETHKHGVRLVAEIADLTAKGGIRNKAKAEGLRIEVHALQALNDRRRRELVKLEHEHPPKPTPPTPKPTPKPAPTQVRFEMFDSTNVNNLPHDAVAVAGYIDGKFANFHDLVLRFPKAKCLSITVLADGVADCLDIEAGDATPASAPGWVRKQHSIGDKRPILYANRSTMPAVIAALTNDDIKREEYMLWVAEYDGTPHIPTGFDACQFTDHDELYDVSMCEPYFL